MSGIILRPIPTKVWFILATNMKTLLNEGHKSLLYVLCLIFWLHITGNIFKRPATLPVHKLKLFFLGFSVKYSPIIYLMDRRSTFKEIQHLQSNINALRCQKLLNLYDLTYCWASKMKNRWLPLQVQSGYTVLFSFLAFSKKHFTVTLPSSIIIPF